MSWRLRRQLIFFGFVAIILLMIMGYVAYKAIPRGTCFDGILNQNETNLDCGGVCGPCLENQVDDLVVIWSRFFEVRPGVYDIASLVKNPNLIAGIEDVGYVFKLFDEDGRLLANERGETFALPNQDILIFNPSITTGRRVPKSASIVLDDITWTRMVEQDLPLDIIHVDRMLDVERPRLLVTLRNHSIRDVLGVEVSAILSDRNGNAIGAGRSVIEIIPDTGTAEAIFTWPFPFDAPIEDIDFVIRQDPWQDF